MYFILSGDEALAWLWLKIMSFVVRATFNPSTIQQL